MIDACDQTLTDLIDRYVRLEKQVQKLMAPFSGHNCGACSGACCREEICKETIDSTFLSVLVGTQKIQYDQTNGWQSVAGCRLDYGRPLVCYEYFCEEIMESKPFQHSLIEQFIDGFVSIGNKAHGSTHLLCIPDLDVLSPQKIDKLCHKIGLLLDEIAEAR